MVTTHLRHAASKLNLARLSGRTLLTLVFLVLSFLAQGQSQVEQASLESEVPGMAVGTLLISIGVIILLLLCSALISGSEAAFFSLSRKEVEELQSENAGDERGRKRARNVANLLVEPPFLLSTILVANNFINIGIVIVSGYLLESIVNTGTDWGDFLISVVMATFLLVLFGEVVPKVYTARNASEFAMRMARPLSLLGRLLHPLNLVLVTSTRFIENRMAKIDREQASPEEFDRAIELATDEETTEQDKKILKGIVQFGSISATQIMTAHTDMTSVEYGTALGDLVQRARESGYSRIPVWREDKNNIVGIFYTKDLLAYLDDSVKDFDWNKVHEAYFVPETKKIDDLLREFQERRSHMAIVVDEYGGTSGLVTLEDIMEEVIGEIQDEFDEQEVDFRKIDDYNYVFAGRVQLGDVCKVLGMRTDVFDEIRGESDTLAGLILELMGKIPAANEQVLQDEFRFTILEVSRSRIEKVKITLSENQTMSVA